MLAHPGSDFLFSLARVKNRVWSPFAGAMSVEREQEHRFDSRTFPICIAPFPAGGEEASHLPRELRANGDQLWAGREARRPAGDAQAAQGACVLLSEPSVFSSFVTYTRTVTMRMH